MVADKSYLAVPTLTGFTIVRGAIKEAKEYTAANGQPLKRIETGAQRFDANMTTFQPVYGLDADGNPAVLRYVDLGTDEHSFPKEVPTQQVEAGGPVVVGMDTVLDAETLSSFKDILTSIMAADIPDFASQPVELSAIGVTRYFNIDRIAFAGRFDRPNEAMLELVIGVYSDIACTELRMVMVQKFVAAKIIEEKQALIAQWTKALANNRIEMAASETTVERKAELATYIKAHVAQIAAASLELTYLQPLAVVVAKPLIRSAMKTITESVLTQYKVVKPAYANINVPALMSLFDPSFDQLVGLIAAGTSVVEPEPTAEPVVAAA